MSVADDPDLPALIARIANGDREAEPQVIDYFRPRIRAMVLARTRDRDAAGDLTQDVLLAVLRAARKGQIRDAARVGAFVSGVARNLVNNYRRQQQRRPEMPLDENSPGMMVEDDHERLERGRLMAQALAGLSAADRQVLTLTLVEGLKPGEIAVHIGATAEVVRTRKSRALKRILEILGRPVT
jgi:RNA polymerase sigma-70 factor, ECF subfamily